MKTNNNVKIHGRFEQKIYKVIDGEKKLIEHYIDDNKVVDVGREKLCKLLANDGVNHYISAIAVGTSNTSPTVADTSLTDQFYKSVDSYSFPTTTSVKFSWTLELTDAVGKAIAEYGLLCQDGTLFSRITRGTINKESDVVINGEWTITFV